MTTDVLDEIKHSIAHDNDALEFMVLYSRYVHLVDDIIDNKDSSLNTVLKTQHAARNVFSHRFYQRYTRELYIVEALINDMYKTSVEWEQSNLSWKRRHAACMRHIGYLMPLAVVLIVGGEEALANVSSRYKEQSHLKHLNDEKEFDSTGEMVKAS